MPKNLVLIVDDKKENREAAAFFFKDIGVKVDFATNYSEGLKKLEKNWKKYQCAIFDKQLPLNENSKPEDLGFDLANKAQEYLLPYAIVTSGIDHHKCHAAFVSYFWDDNEGERKFHEITETPKNNPRAWEEIYKTLLNPCRNSSALKPLHWALKRIGSDISSILMTPAGKLAKKIL